MYLCMFDGDKYFRANNSWPIHRDFGLNTLKSVHKFRLIVGAWSGDRICPDQLFFYRFLLNQLKLHNIL